MSIVVVKFGGSSLADAGQVKKIIEIIRENPDRRYIVPSAPGKRFATDKKITDLLYDLHTEEVSGKSTDEIFSQISKRFIKMSAELGCAFSMKGELDVIYDELKNGATVEYIASRGEYLCSLIVADVLGYDFIDAADVIKFDNRHKYDSVTTMKKLKAEFAKHERAVIPGFFGSHPDGKIQTFSRGGSDISGAIIAAAAGADIYENWTDVSGFMRADPRIIPDAQPIDFVTYKELRELSYMGATVLHEDAIFPVYSQAIAINVKNTNAPGDKGTMIVPFIEGDKMAGVTGIAGKKNFTVISIEKNGMNSELGFGRKVLSCIETYGIPFEHMPSGIDTLCVVLEDAKLADKLRDITEDIHRHCEPDSIEVFSNMALVATVGRGMIRSVGTAAKLFTALATAGVNIRMIDQGSSEMNIIVGVENAQFEKAVGAVYDALIRNN